MPELAEVLYFRRVWEAGLGRKVEEVRLREGARVWRGVPTAEVLRQLGGACLATAQSHGKWMLFSVARGVATVGWLGVHLGMTGALVVEPEPYPWGKHDHLSLRLGDGSWLVFRDPRGFGRLRWEGAGTEPRWWCEQPAAIDSPAFTPRRLQVAFARWRRTPLKSALLRQEVFPGVGNWMADEVLWRCRLPPDRTCGSLSPEETRGLCQWVRWVAAGACRSIGVRGLEAAPEGWLFHRRWSDGQPCPRCGGALLRAPVGGRTSCWCPVCQPGRAVPKPSTAARRRSK